MSSFISSGAGGGTGQLSDITYSANSMGQHSHITGASISMSSHSVQVATIESIKELDDRLVALEKMLIMLKAEEVLQEKYPALKEAYDHYQMVLALVNQPSEK